MIVKEFEFNKININNYNLYLLHGKNEGLKKEIISKIVSKNESVEIQKLDERQILENQELSYNVCDCIICFYLFIYIHLFIHIALP